MPFSGGVFSRVYSWATDAAAGIKIRADRMDEEMNGFATGLSTCVTKDGQTTITNDLPMAGFKHTGVGNATARTQYASMAQVQDQGGVYVATVGGTADAITLTPSPAITAYAAGQRFSFIAPGTNTTNVTIATSGLATRAVTKEGSTALVAGDIVSGALVIVQDDGTRYQLVSVGGVATKHGANTFTGANTFQGVNSFTKVQKWAKGADVASANALTLGTDGNYFDITGTTSITSIGTLGAGTTVKLHFDDALTLTHHTTDLILPGAANITTAAGDEFEFTEYATGDWRCTAYVLASGQTIGGQSGSERLIATYTPSAAADQAITGFNASLYVDYRIRLDHVLPATSATVLQLLTSTDGGSNYDTGSSDYRWIADGGLGVNTALIQGDAADGEIEITGAVLGGAGNGAGDGISGDIWIVNPGAAAKCRVFWRVTLNTAAGNWACSQGSGTRDTAANVDAVKLLFSSGNIASGTIRFYGTRV